MEVSTRKLYIVLTYTNSVIARGIRMYSKEPYSHVSLAFDEQLEEMYSFARRGIYNPFNAGFIQEDIDTGVFARKTKTECCVLELTVSAQEYRRAKRVVKQFMRRRDMLSYNYLGILGVVLNRPIYREGRYFCSQFVATVLQQSGVNIFDIQPALIKPRDFRLCPQLQRVYAGRLREYRQTALGV